MWRQQHQLALSSQELSSFPAVNLGLTQQRLLWSKQVWLLVLQFIICHALGGKLYSHLVFLLPTLLLSLLAIYWKCHFLKKWACTWQNTKSYIRWITGCLDFWYIINLRPTTVVCVKSKLFYKQCKERLTFKNDLYKLTKLQVVLQNYAL